MTIWRLPGAPPGLGGGRIARRVLFSAGLLVAGGTLLARPATFAHTGGHADWSASQAQVLAPGWGPLRFDAPTPGSYNLPPLGAAGDGKVLASGGQATTLHEVYGDKLVLLSFMYTSCSDVNGCPLATAVFGKLAQALSRQPGISRHLRLVSLSFDPRRDTPQALARYARLFRRGGVDWRFLTTRSTRELVPILDAYGQSVVAERDAGGNETGAISHVLRVYLIDRKKRIRNVYSVSFLHAGTLASDIQTVLLAERANAAAIAPAAPVIVAARPGQQGPGDGRGGYEHADYHSDSRAVPERRGKRADLLGFATRPVLGLPPVPVPGDNPLSERKIALGRKLFYDRRLSLNDTISCAMCHVPEQGFSSNELATAVGIEGRTVRRNAPSLYNVAYARRLFHDGRETRLEQQVWGPMLASSEMGNPAIGTLIEKIGRMADYRGLFEAAFAGRGPGMETIGMAIASYERTLVSANSPFDRWRFGAEALALGEAAKRGFALFTGKARCAACHSVGERTALFSDGRFHNTGVGYAGSMRREPEKRKVQIAPGVFVAVDGAVMTQASQPRPSDLGRYEVTQDPADRWKYKTPSLRNVALSAPYMHDGSLGSLRQVVELYNRGGIANRGLDPLIRPLGLSGAELDDLVAFLLSLTGDSVDALVSDAFAAPIGDP